MIAAEAREALRVGFAAGEFALGAELAPERLLEALRTLRDRFGFRYYVLASATERPDAIEVVHGLRNLETGEELFVKVRLPKEDPVADSAAFVFAGAEWHEREILDLFGVTFRNHPDPRRILLPDEYPGHPLRKDFAMDTPWGYRPATRGEGG